MAADSRRLRKVLGRFKKSELPAVLRHLGVEAEERGRAPTKQQLLARALQSHKVCQCGGRGLQSRHFHEFETCDHTHRLVASLREISLAWSFIVSPG